MVQDKARDLPHATTRVDEWVDAWRESGAFVLLLDFDGTLSPIVERPELATISQQARSAILGLVASGVEVAIVSGRGLADARNRVGIPNLAFAGNHGMEIEMPGISRIHPEAAALGPLLRAVRDQLTSILSTVEGAIVEDKGLTLSIHYRQVDRNDVDAVRQAVRQATEGREGLRVTEGKEVLEIRPKVDWHKGKAVRFVLDQLNLPDGAPVLYIGDDRTDEDAFEELEREGRGEGVLVGEVPEQGTAARSGVKTTEEVADLLDLLHHRAPSDSRKH